MQWCDNNNPLTVTHPYTQGTHTILKYTHKFWALQLYTYSTDTLNYKLVLLTTAGYYQPLWTLSIIHTHSDTTLWQCWNVHAMKWTVTEWQEMTKPGHYTTNWKPLNDYIIIIISRVTINFLTDILSIHSDIHDKLLAKI